MNQILEILKSSRGASYENNPALLQNVINLEACGGIWVLKMFLFVYCNYFSRKLLGATKFGDPLTIDECEKLLENLANCNLPFQCAHGRPTLTPLIYLTEYAKTVSNNVSEFSTKLQERFSQYRLDKSTAK